MQSALRMFSRSDAQNRVGLEYIGEARNNAMRVVILAPPGVQSLDVVGPAEVFWEAARRLGNPSAYEVQVMATTSEPVRGTGGSYDA